MYIYKINNNKHSKASKQAKNQLAAWGIAGPKTISVNSYIRGSCTSLLLWLPIFPRLMLIHFRKYTFPVKIAEGEKQFLVLFY